MLTTYTIKISFRGSYFRIRVSFILVYFIVFVTSCIEPYEYDSEIGVHEILVVDAKISNLSGNSYVALKFVAPYENGATYKEDLEAATGEAVLVTDEKGFVTSFYEDLPGFYLPESKDFSAREGSSYQLSIFLKDGRNYSSDYLDLPPSVSMDGIKCEYQPGLSVHHPRDSVDGFMIYVMPSLDSPGSVFLKYDIYETWEQPHWGYEWYIYYSWQSENSTNFPQWPYDTIVPEICYREHHPLRFLNICSLQDKTQISSYLHPLTHISVKDSRLVRLYSVEIEQMAINRECFQYWQQIKDQDSYTGSIFDSRPGKIASNIYCTNDPEAQVAGFFTLGNSVRQRFFIRGDTLMPRPEYHSSCIGYEIWAEDPWGLRHPYGWPDLFNDNSPCCFQCNKCVDSKSRKPEFWPE